uniref:Uncharacterized protein n=1 Tax=Solanum tuberosum TaxID=4113 RepID=M1AVS3_SOLTU
MAMDTANRLSAIAAEMGQLQNEIQEHRRVLNFLLRSVRTMDPARKEARIRATRERIEDCDPPLNPIPYLTLKTHYRVVTEVDQEKGRCPDDRFDPMSNWPKAQNETSQGSRMTSLTDHRARKTLYAAFQVEKLYKRVIKLG